MGTISSYREARKQRRLRRRAAGRQAAREVCLKKMYESVERQTQYILDGNETRATLEALDQLTLRFYFEQFTEESE
jgi:hypothetical protein